MKTRLAVLTLVALVLGVLLSSLQEFNLTEVNMGGRPSLSIDGRLLGGILAIKSARNEQKDRCIVLIVRVGITRPGLRDARFHYDIPIPDDVDKVSFGNASDIIWTRSH